MVLARWMERSLDLFDPRVLAVVVVVVVTVVLRVLAVLSAILRVAQLMLLLDDVVMTVLLLLLAQLADSIVMALELNEIVRGSDGHCLVNLDRMVAVVVVVVAAVIYDHAIGAWEDRTS